MSIQIKDGEPAAFEPDPFLAAEEPPPTRDALLSALVGLDGHQARSLREWLMDLPAESLVRLGLWEDAEVLVCVQPDGMRLHVAPLLFRPQAIGPMPPDFETLRAVRRALGTASVRVTLPGEE